MSAEKKDSRWACVGYVTAMLPDGFGPELSGLARRVGISLYGNRGGRPLADIGGGLENLTRYWAMLQSPCPHIFLETVAHTDRRPCDFPEGYQPDDEGYIKLRTHDIFELITFTYLVAEMLDLEIPEAFRNMVAKVPDGQYVANHCSGRIKKHTVITLDPPK